MDMIDLRSDTVTRPDAATIVARARKRGVLVSAFAARTIRVTTHLDVDELASVRAGAPLADVVQATGMQG